MSPSRPRPVPDEPCALAASASGSVRALCLQGGSSASWCGSVMHMRAGATVGTRVPQREAAAAVCSSGNGSVSGARASAPRASRRLFRI